MDATDVDDPLKTCPYDKSHRIRKSRFQAHLLHCRESNAEYKKKCTKICPFNVFHVIPVEEFEAHLAECPNRESANDEEFEETNHIGSVPLEELNKIYVPPSQENWDEDPPAETYDPLQQALSKGVLIAPVGLSTAKKRAFRRAERQRFMSLEGRSGRSDTRSKSVKEKNYRTYRSPQASSLPATTRELDECHRKLMSLSEIGEDELNDTQPALGLLESDEEEPEFHLRPPRTKSIALSTTSDSSYQDLTLDVSTISEMEKNLTKLYDSFLD